MIVLLRALIPEIAACLGIESGRRLVKEQNGRIVHECDREQQSLLLATRKLAVVASCEFFQCAQPDDFFDVEPAVIQPAEHRKGLSHGEEILQRCLLEQNARFLAKALAEKLPAVMHLARGRSENAFHHLDRRGLSRAVRAEQTEADSLGDAKRNPVHRVHVRVALDEIADF
jgi:hypothetical protein